MFKCFHCKEQLILKNEFDVEDRPPEFEYHFEHQILSVYQCSNKECEAWYEVNTKKRKKYEK